MNKDELNGFLDITMEILAIDTVAAEPQPNAPYGIGNLKALTRVLEYAQSLGFSTCNLDGHVGYADIGSGETFGILGHLDTVPIGEGWTHNPYGEISNGVLYGRGALDDKAPVLACLYAAGELAKTKTPKKRLRFIFGCNEESGWGCINRYNLTEQMPNSGFSPDADFPVIYAEKGIVNYVVTLPYDLNISVSGGDRANVVPNRCEAKLAGKEYRTDGVSAHGSHPAEGENAIVNMLDLLIQKLEAAHEKSKTYRSLLTAKKLFGNYDGSGAGLKTSDESGELTLNLGVVNSDENSIVFTIDIRYPVGRKEQEIYELLNAALSAATAKFDTPISYQITKSHFHLPLFVDKSNDLVTTLLSVYNDCTGEHAEPIAIGGGTYARALPVGVAFGPIFASEPLPIHCPDEHVPIASLCRTYDIYKAAIEKLCF